MKFIKSILLLLLTTIIIQISTFRRTRSLIKRNRGDCNLWKGTVLPDSEIQIIIQKHNELRNKIAAGTESGKDSIPAASNMRQVYWSTKIAAKAQAWANNCKFKHSTAKYRQQGTMRVGENIYDRSQTKKVAPELMEWDKCIGAWYGEIKRFSSSQINPAKFINKTGHFTQVIWAESYLIGCGYSFIKTGKWYKGIYVCEYGPAGNFEKHPIFLEGAACSACPTGTACSTDYPGLCCVAENCTKDKVVTPTEP